MTTMFDPRIVHDTLLGLAGRVPDDELAVLRTCLADEEYDDFADVLGGALSAGRLTLNPAELTTLQAMCGSAELDQVRAAAPPEPEWRFEPGPNDADVHETDAIAVAAAERVGGLLALWRVERVDPTLRARVLLGEAAPDGDVIELAAEMQHALAEAGHLPRVEVFAEGTSLSGYHDAALAVARLVWQAQPRPAVRLARVFDGVGPTVGPYFRHDHPIAGRDDGARVAAYLRAAEIVLHSPWRGDDIVSPHLTGVVPADFRSDGTWVWPDTVLYYLETYGLAPEPDLARHVLAAGTPGPLSRLAEHRAHAVLSGAVEEEKR
jgi:hypothetical protein